METAVSSLAPNKSSFETHETLCCTICFVQLNSHINHLYSLWVIPLWEIYWACLNLLKLSQFIKSPYPVSSALHTWWRGEKNSCNHKMFSLISVPPSVIHASSGYWLQWHFLHAHSSLTSTMFLQKPCAKTFRRDADMVTSGLKRKALTCSPLS